MTTVRLLADDLTGALDTAAEFVPLAGEFPVLWTAGGEHEPTGSLGLDSGTRELGAEAAMAAVSRLVANLRAADIAFKKIDSLLRGPALAEIAACMRTGFWPFCVLAPAFPYQGRVTRGGRQYREGADGWAAVGEDLVAGLRLWGVAAQQASADADLQPGVNVFDAETDADMQRIVARTRRCAGPVLWVGTGGLAQAIAVGHPHPRPSALPRPILGVFGSDQATTAGQLAACAPHWWAVEGDDVDPVLKRLDAAGIVLVSFRLPSDTPRASAAGWIASGIARLTDRMGPPGTLVVAGGETLRSVCETLRARSLLVRGRLVPGVPLSTIQGGRWHGVTVVSKSGAFGHPLLLRELIVERADS